MAALTDPDASVRQVALWAIQALDEIRAFDASLAALSDADAGVRGAAIGCLNDIGDPRAASPIADMLTDPDADVRASAAAALGSLGDDSAIAPLEELAAHDTSVRQPFNRQVAITAHFALERIRERLRRRNESSGASSDLRGPMEGEN